MAGLTARRFIKAAIGMAIRQPRLRRLGVAILKPFPAVRQRMIRVASGGMMARNLTGSRGKRVSTADARAQATLGRAGQIAFRQLRTAIDLHGD